MSEHRGREVSKLKGPEHHLDLFTPVQLSGELLP